MEVMIGSVYNLNITFCVFWQVQLQKKVRNFSQGLESIVRTISVFLSRQVKSKSALLLE